MLETESPPQPPTRPTAVTASAVIVFLGSAMAVFFAGLIVVGLLTVQEQVDNTRPIALALAAIAAGLGALGIATGIGVLRLRPWARISILVFAGIMAVMCFLAAALMMFAPFPTPPNPAMSASAMRGFLVIVYVIPGSIGVWWLVLFNKRATKDAFASGALPGASRVPLSIMIIGWWMLIGGIVSFIPSLIGVPAFIAGAILTGWAARVTYFLFAAIGIYLGWGLLKLQERARVLAIAWFALAFLHGAYAAISPTARARMREMEGAMGGAAARQSPDVPTTAGDTTGLTIAILVFTLMLIVVGVWFLVRNKRAFQAHQTNAVLTGPPI